MKSWKLKSAAMLVAASCGSGSGSPAVPTATTVGQVITGTVIVQRDLGAVIREGDQCAGIGGFNDIVEGAQVTAKDQAGTILAVGRLGRGVGIKSGRTTLAFYVIWCQLEFTVGPVSKQPFYQVEVGRRSPVTYSHEELASKNWHVDLTLG